MYCPTINRIFATRNVVFDETLFPLRLHDQRIYGKYDYAVVEEMRASKHMRTLDQEAPVPDEKSLLWPLNTLEQLQCESIVTWEEKTATMTPVAGNGSEPDLIIDSDDECDDENKDDEEGTEVGELSGATSTTILRPNTRRSKVGGKQPKRCAKAQQPVQESTWEDCAMTEIEKCSDFELAEYLVGSSTRLTLDESYWPGDKGKWKVECTDAETRRGVVVLECTLISGPRRVRNDERVVIYVSEHNGKDFSA